MRKDLTLETTIGHMHMPDISQSVIKQASLYQALEMYDKVGMMTMIHKHDIIYGTSGREVKPHLALLR